MWNDFVELVRGWSLLSMIIRLLLALIVGIVIGGNRSVKHRGAGIKTHSLVCLGSAIVMMLGQYLYINFPEKVDIARIGAQVVSGVGFLGVGTIIVTGKNQVKGLTTAAGLWTSACLGLAAGIGYVEGVIICLVLVLFTLTFLKRLDDVLRNKAKNTEFYIEFDSERSVGNFIKNVHSLGWKMSIVELSRGDEEGHGRTAIVTIKVDERKTRSKLKDILKKMEGLEVVEEL